VTCFAALQQKERDMLIITKRARSSRGFTLTEAAIVLAIVGLVLSAIWAASTGVFGNMKSNDAQNGITLAAQQIHAMYGNSNDTGKAAAGTILAAGMLPAGWVNPAGPFYGNPWHKNAPASFSDVVGHNGFFSIILNQIDPSGCVQLANYFSFKSAAAQGGNLTGLNGDVIASGALATIASTAASLREVKPAVLANFDQATACGAGSPGTSAIAITFDMSAM
jgi:prepilin-type N-terminal cleavage/methylation domain-containing protein